MVLDRERTVSVVNIKQNFELYRSRTFREIVYNPLNAVLQAKVASMSNYILTKIFFKR